MEHQLFKLIFSHAVTIKKLSCATYMFKEMNFISNALSFRSYSLVICIYIDVSAIYTNKYCLNLTGLRCRPRNPYPRANR